MRKLILLFDGTWNDKSDNTNVWKLKEVISDTDGEYPQVVYYHKGVGTDIWTKIRGGLYGYGIDDNIKDGYKWLIENYRDGDEIFLFGFSRGSYTARSLVGFIRKCGLLHTGKKHLVDEAYEIYRVKKIHPDSTKALTFRSANSREIPVKFIGVWDTVGSLGVPFPFALFRSGRYTWHDTALSKIVEYAYHALAVDEHRKHYNAVVWSVMKRENREVEQRWFIGAHGNVGGAYHKVPEDALSLITLHWMQSKAKASGLRFSKQFLPPEGASLAPVNNSYKEFMFGIYALLFSPFYRKVGEGAGAIIDDSIFERMKQDREYKYRTKA